MGPARAHGHSGRKTYALMSSRAPNPRLDVKQSSTKLLHDIRARAVRLTYIQFFLTGNPIQSRHRQCNLH